MTADRPLLGIGLMLGFCVLAPMTDAIAKSLGDSIPLLQLLLTRFAAQVILLLPFVWYSGSILAPSRRVVRLTAIRTVLHIFGIGMMFSALRYLPLADAVAIAFVMPFIMLLLGRYILNEEVGPRRLIACAVGFIGTLFVVQPSFAEVGWPALLPLGVAVVFSFFMLVTRQIAKEIDPIALQSLSGLMALPVLFLLILIPNGMAELPMFSVVFPDVGDLVLLIALGAMGTLAHLLMSWSLRFAPSATLAPMQYLEIPVATAIGWLVFRDLPNGLAAFGIALTVASGLYIVLRERALSRLPAPPAV
ncbi:MAG: drug/metabolite transporter (DMT)-like permease [Glaciecola sp.]|jgi:drug/metabolite transporter (DMT)-like permease